MNDETLDGYCCKKDDNGNPHTFYIEQSTIPILLDDCAQGDGVKFYLADVVDKRITELERQNTDLQRNNTDLVMENRELKTPAKRWRALISCERLRLLGRAGFDNDDKSGYRHFGMEFWTKWDGSTFDNSREIDTLEKYTDCLIERIPV